MLSFVFGALLMLLTVITFALGANIEKCICEPMTDDNYEVFVEVCH